MGTNPIGDALAIALDEMDEYATEERYSEPALAARIRSVRAAMAELQLLLDEGSRPALSRVKGSDDDMSPTARMPSLPTPAATIAPNDGTALTPGRPDGPKLPDKG